MQAGDKRTGHLRLTEKMLSAQELSRRMSQMTEFKIRVIRSIFLQVVRTNEIVARLLCEFYFL